MRMVAALYYGGADSVVRMRLGCEIIGCAVQVRYGRRGHGMLVRAHVIDQRVRAYFGGRRIFLDGEIRGIPSGSGCRRVSVGNRNSVETGFRRLEFRTARRYAE